MADDLPSLELAYLAGQRGMQNLVEELADKLPKVGNVVSRACLRAEALRAVDMSPGERVELELNRAYWVRRTRRLEVLAAHISALDQLLKEEAADGG